jgi:DNA-binding winged helix-turn-helix (wHTH) protein
VVDVYINYLRRKLGDTGPAHLIETVRGQGYRIAVLAPRLGQPADIYALTSRMGA